jgi:hypothetical protein
METQAASYYSFALIGASAFLSIAAMALAIVRILADAGYFSRNNKK